MGDDQLTNSRLAITLFGIFLGGWWTSLLLDIFSSGVPLQNKIVIMIYIPIIYGTFYLIVYNKSYRIQAVIFTLCDVFIAGNLLFYFSPDPAVQGEAFLLKTLMAIISLIILQILIVFYLRLPAKKPAQPTKDKTQSPKHQ